ncbi:nitroreductase, partial [Streptomyces aureus]
MLGASFRQNALEHGSFGYHTVTMDVGSLLQTWRLWARAHGLHIGSALWFDERRLGRLLGLDPREDGVFAVVPLRWAGDAPAVPARRTPVAAVRRVPEAKPDRILFLPTVDRIHTATLKLPPAACRLPPAACRLPPAACRLPPDFQFK